MAGGATVAGGAHLQNELPGRLGQSHLIGEASERRKELHLGVVEVLPAPCVCPCFGDHIICCERKLPAHCCTSTLEEAPCGRTQSGKQSNVGGDRGCCWRSRSVRSHTTAAFSQTSIVNDNVMVTRHTAIVTCLTKSVTLSVRSIK